MATGPMITVPMVTDGAREGHRNRAAPGRDVRERYRNRPGTTVHPAGCTGRPTAPRTARPVVQVTVHLTIFGGPLPSPEHHFPVVPTWTSPVPPASRTGP